MSDGEEAIVRLREAVKGIAPADDAALVQDAASEIERLLAGKRVPRPEDAEIEKYAALATGTPALSDEAQREIDYYAKIAEGKR
jgi:hypothetical protein